MSSRASRAELRSGSVAFRKPEASTQFIQVADHAAKRFLEVPHARFRNGGLTTTPSASPCSAPGRSCSQASPRAPSSASLHPGGSRRSRAPNHPLGELSARSPAITQVSEGGRATRRRILDQVLPASRILAVVASQSFFPRQPRRSHWVSLSVGIVITAAVLPVLDAARTTYREREALKNAAAVREGDMVEHSMDPSWVVEGNGKYRAHTYAVSANGTEQSGIWECTGPSTFDWHFGNDETVYILDGEVHIEYDGRKRSLVPGSVAFFPAGAKARWHVASHVRKSFHVSQPSFLNRALRRVLYR